MPKLHELAVTETNVVLVQSQKPDQLWQIWAYRAIRNQLDISHQLLLEKLVSELEYEAELATINRPSIDFSLLQKVGRNDLLQTIQDTDQNQD